VGLRKEIEAQKRTQRLAAEILKVEHGTKHLPGARADLCPLCEGHDAAPPTYPVGWPRCVSCGDYAIDGHLTCGRLECNESGARS